ncbi:MAG: carboxypeptidase-like regulatory domain-containing protein, partial [Promethearchaeota archaeon]
MGNKKHIYHVLAILAIFFLLTADAFSGTTGKIAGIVIDAESGQGLAGVNVVIEGTTLGAATDLNGNFIILMVPPGIYNVRAMMIGYKNFRYENVKVSIDLTTRLEFKLRSSVIDMGEEVTV